MKKLAVTDADIMRIALQQEIQRSEESRYDNRLHGVLLHCNGMTCERIAGVLGHGVRTVQYWIRKFNVDGFAGLQDHEGRGRRSRLENKEIEKIGRDLRKTPRDFGYIQNLWDGKILSYHIEKRYGKTMGVRQCQRLFHRLEFRLRKPRPMIAQADAAAQAAFKKTPSEKG
jgi:transposase